MHTHKYRKEHKRLEETEEVPALNSRTDRDQKCGCSQMARISPADVIKELRAQPNWVFLWPIPPGAHGTDQCALLLGLILASIT